MEVRSISPSKIMSDKSQILGTPYEPSNLYRLASDLDKQSSDRSMDTQDPAPMLRAQLTKLG